MIYKHKPFSAMFMYRSLRIRWIGHGELSMIQRLVRCIVYRGDVEVSQTMPEVLGLRFVSD
jgi:hypothetical protein